MAMSSLTNPGFKLASTIGRGRYWSDPKSPETVYYTDVYDWNSGEKNFKGGEEGPNTYQKLRNTVRSGEDTNLTKEKNNNYRMNFKLDKKEIEAIRQRKAQEELNFQKNPPYLAIEKQGGQINTMKYQIRKAQMGMKYSIGTNKLPINFQNPNAINTHLDALIGRYKTGETGETSYN